MKRRRIPVRVSRENHLKAIVLLLVLVGVSLCLSRHVFVPADESCRTLPAGNVLQKDGGSEVRNRNVGEAGGPGLRENGAGDRAGNGAGRSLGKKEERSRHGQGRLVSGNAALELPFCPDTAFIIRNTAGRYTLLYDTAYRQARWVAYLLTRKEVRTKGAGRSNAFRSDPEVVSRNWPTATDRCYAGSGFDRGHLLPSADRDDTPQENRSTFYFSNISPQRPALNRRVWKTLEEQVREWADRYDSLYVVTGGDLRPGLPRIAGGVGVPDRFFKALLVRGPEGFRAVAFLIPNSEKQQGGYADYIVTVDELERQTGLDLFCNLPDSVERRVESTVDRNFWR